MRCICLCRFVDALFDYNLRCSAVAIVTIHKVHNLLRLF